MFHSNIVYDTSFQKHAYKHVYVCINIRTCPLVCSSRRLLLQVAKNPKHSVHCPPPASAPLALAIRSRVLFCRAFPGFFVPFFFFRLLCESNAVITSDKGMQRVILSVASFSMWCICV